MASDMAEYLARWEAERRRDAYLALADGSLFRGYSLGAPVDAVGEAVFNTGMTGYQEIISDPSYAGQIVCLTAPEIGNYGLNQEDWESGGIHVSGLVVHRLSLEASNGRAREKTAGRLARAGVPALAGINTRALTLRLRERGSQKAFLCASGKTPEEEGLARARAWEGLDGQDYAVRVGTRVSYAWEEGLPGFDPGYPEGEMSTEPPPVRYRIAAFDFGVKWSILRSLRRAGFAVSVIPPDARAEDALALNPDGAFFSNGPGDPAAVAYAADTVRKLLGRLPIMGVCLGHQLLGLACGGRTYRLPFGHHGCNHPVRELESGSVLITSQNHNFAVDADSLPASRAEVTHLSLNDQSVEGIRLRDAPAFSVQFHPEAGPGPHDAMPQFRRFAELIAEAGRR